MKQILLEKVIPSVFLDRKDLSSEIWMQNVRFQKGNIYLIEAESGAGKSSFCSFIYGARKDFSGNLLFDDEDIRSFSHSRWENIRKKSISFVFQDLLLFDELTAIENVELKNQLTGYQTKEQILQWFDELGLSDQTEKKAGKLSWGQKQRVALIRALCQPFDFLLLDEPISHLDDKNGIRFKEIMLKEVERQGAGAIITSVGKHLEMPYNQIIRL